MNANADALIERGRGLPLDYTLPTSGTVVIDDAIGLVKGARHAAAAELFIDWAGSDEALLLAARGVYRLPARTDLPKDSLPKDQLSSADLAQDDGLADDYDLTASDTSGFDSDDI